MDRPTTLHVRMKFDLPGEYTRAIRVRAALRDVFPRDVLVAALDIYLADELRTVRAGLPLYAPPAPPDPT